MAKKKSKAKSRAKSVKVSKKKPARKLIRKRKQTRKPVRKPARVPKPVYTSGPAPWYQAFATDRDRRGQLAYLKDGLQKVRKIYGGFDSKDGFDVRFLDRLPTERYQDLRDHISPVNREMSRGHEFGKEEWMIVRPRSKAQKDALLRHTVEPLGSRTHPRRAFIIETGAPARTTIRYVKGPVLRGWKKTAIWGTGLAYLQPIVEEGLRVEVVDPFKGGETAFRDYIFAEILGWQPGLELQKGMEGAKFLDLPQDPWEQMLFAVKQILPLLPRKTPGGKDAYYQLLGSNGPISTVYSADDLLWGMRKFYEKGGSGYIDIERRARDPSASTFTETLIGLRYQGTELQAIGSPRSAVSRLERRRARYRKLEKRLHQQRMKIRLKSIAPKKFKRKQPRRKK